MITVFSAAMYKPCVLLLRAGRHNPTRREKKSIASFQEMMKHLHHHSDGQACKWNKDTQLRIKLKQLSWSSINSIVDPYPHLAATADISSGSIFFGNASNNTLSLSAWRVKKIQWTLYEINKIKIRVIKQQAFCSTISNYFLLKICTNHDFTEWCVQDNNSCRMFLRKRCTKHKSLTSLHCYSTVLNINKQDKMLALIIYY